MLEEIASKNTGLEVSEGRMPHKPINTVIQNLYRQNPYP
jgi:hypothetical protein